mmetsp:Transcript_806/g.1554  ORF Transcript_806/g.1554 Transcript_806/m.1554 type:complete len:88 (+) Transcript_806:206-469(+)
MSCSMSQLPTLFRVATALETIVGIGTNVTASGKESSDSRQQPQQLQQLQQLVQLSTAPSAALPAAQRLDRLGHDSSLHYGARACSSN